MPFQVKHIVSLGAWCQVTYQLRRFFGSSVSSPYDWLVTPFDALSKSIQDEGRQLGQAVTVRDEVRPLCFHYGLLYHHEFPTSGEIPIISAQSLLTCESKLKHKYRRMAEAIRSGGTLFVRMGGHALPAFPSPYVTDQIPFTDGDVNKLIELLERRFNCADFRLLFINIEGRTNMDIRNEADGRVVFRSLPSSVETHTWMGNNEDWDRLLLNLPFTIATGSGSCVMNPYDETDAAFR
ncbi:DUF1796 family putative cysteine peptidase [Methylorubrum aminovorans]